MCDGERVDVERGAEGRRKRREVAERDKEEEERKGKERKQEVKEETRF